MGKLRAWHARLFNFLGVHMILHCLLHLFLNLDGVYGFNPLIQLKRHRHFRSRDGSSTVLNVNDFGAIGDGITDNTKAFKALWKTVCALPSEPKIVLPAGNSYLVGPMDFSGPCKSKVTFRVSGSIVAPKDPGVWNGTDTHKWLYFQKVKHLTIEGGGTINGMGQEWWARSCKRNTSYPCQHAPTAITFHRCNNLKVRKIQIIDSQQMHMAFTSCTQVAASHLTITAPGDSPNTDGIHISATTHVEVKDTTISTGDDCISIVNNSSRIRIKNISCGPGHGISIGSLGRANSWAQVHDVSVDGALLSNTKNGVRIKTWQGGSGYVKKITFENMVMVNVSNPIIIDQYYCDSSKPCLNQTLAVNIQSISFIGIKGTSVTEEAIRFACSDSFPCKKLYLEDIQLDSYSGGDTKSFCWQAYGSTSGHVYPTPCFSNDKSITQKNILSSLVESF